MGDIGGKLRADAFGSLQVCHIGDEDRGSHILALKLPPGHWRDKQAQAAGVVVECVHLQHDGRILFPGLSDGLPETAAAGEKKRSVLISICRKAEESPGRPVGRQYIALLIQENQTLVHTVQNQAHLVPLFLDGLDIAAQPLHQLVNVAQNGPQLVVGLVFLQNRSAGAVQHALEGISYYIERLQHLGGGASRQGQCQQETGCSGQCKSPYGAQHQGIDGGQRHGGAAHYAVGKALGYVQHGLSRAFGAPW